MLRVKGRICVALLAVVLPVLAVLGRFTRAVVMLTLLVFVLTFVQVSLVTYVAAWRMPALSALHPANALVLFAVALSAGHRATRWVFGTRGEAGRYAAV